MKKIKKKKRLYFKSLLIGTNFKAYLSYSDALNCCCFVKLYTLFDDSVAAENLIDSNSAVYNTPPDCIYRTGVPVKLKFDNLYTRNNSSDTGYY